MGGSETLYGDEGNDTIHANEFNDASAGDPVIRGPGNKGRVVLDKSFDTIHKSCEIRTPVLGGRQRRRGPPKRWRLEEGPGSQELTAGARVAGYDLVADSLRRAAIIRHSVGT